MSTRHEVYNAINSERNYQDDKWPGHVHSFEEYAVYMEDYLAELKHLLSRNDGNDKGIQLQAQSIMRKVTAMGVAAMEQNGARERGGW